MSRVTQGMLDAFAEAWERQDKAPGNAPGARRRAGLEAVFDVARRDVMASMLGTVPGQPDVDPRADILKRAAPFVRPCGPCDFGLAEFGCQCPTGEYRHVMVDLIAEVKRLRELLYIDQKETEAGENAALAREDGEPF